MGGFTAQVAYDGDMNASVVCFDILSVIAAIRMRHKVIHATGLHHVRSWVVDLRKTTVSLTVDILDGLDEELGRDVGLVPAAVVVKARDLPAFHEWAWLMATHGKLRAVFDNPVEADDWVRRRSACVTGY